MNDLEPLKMMHMLLEKWTHVRPMMSNIDPKGLYLDIMCLTGVHSSSNMHMILRCEGDDSDVVCTAIFDPKGQI